MAKKTVFTYSPVQELKKNTEKIVENGKKSSTDGGAALGALNEEGKKRETARENYAKRHGVFDENTGSYKIVKESENKSGNNSRKNKEKTYSGRSRGAVTPAKKSDSKDIITVEPKVSKGYVDSINTDEQDRVSKLKPSILKDNYFIDNYGEADAETVFADLNREYLEAFRLNDTERYKLIGNEMKIVLDVINFRKTDEYAQKRKNFDKNLYSATMNVLGDGKTSYYDLSPAQKRSADRAIGIHNGFVDGVNAVNKELADTDFSKMSSADIEKIVESSKSDAESNDFVKSQIAKYKVGLWEWMLTEKRTEEKDEQYKADEKLVRAYFGSENIYRVNGEHLELLPFAGKELDDKISTLTKEITSLQSGIAMRKAGRGSGVTDVSAAEKRVAMLEKELSEAKKMKEAAERYVQSTEQRLKEETNRVLYGTIQDSEDFAEKSKADIDVFNNTNNKEGHALYGYINNFEHANGKTYQQVFGNYDGTQGHPDWDIYKYLTAEEKGKFNYLYNSGNYARAVNYLATLDVELSKRRYEKDSQAWGKNAEEHPVLTSVATVAAAPWRAYSSLGAVLDDTSRVIKGEEIDPYSTWHGAENWSTVTRNTVTENIDNEIGKFMYGVSMSIGDNVANMAFGSVLGAGASAIGMSKSAVKSIISNFVGVAMGTTSAASSIVYNKERGLSDKAALGLGLAQGLTEMLTEKYSIEQIIKEPKSALLGVLRGMAAEGSEEIASGAITMSLDYLVTGSDSEISQIISQYKEKGYSDKGAVAMALFMTLGEQGLAGAVSGGIMGAGSNALSKLGSSDVQQETEKPEILYQVEDEAGKVADSETVFYSTDSNEEENKSIKKQIREKMGDIMLSPAVAEIVYDADGGKAVPEMKTEIVQVLASRGRDTDTSVERKGFGPVDLSYKELKKGVKYLHYPEEIYSLPYVADVVKNGIQIYHEDNHKVTGNESFTFAAPVNINGVPHAMGVVVHRSGVTGGNKYHVHRVILPDGSSLVLSEKKETAANLGSVFQENEKPVSPITAVSNAIISQDGEKYNGKKKKVYPGLTAGDIENGNISDDLKVRLENYKKVMTQMGYTVIYEPRRNVPDGTIGYADITNREVYLSPEYLSEALLTHELSHVIDRGYGGKYIKNLVSFFKKNLKDDWDKAEARVKETYKDIPGANIEAETLADMCTKFTTDEYIRKAASMEVGTIKQIAVFCKYVGAKLNSIFLDKSNAQKFKVASLKWQMALYKATKKGAVDGGSGVAYSGNSAKYDYRKSFDEQVEDYKKGAFPENDSLLLGATPEVWRKAGFNALPVTINQTHVDYAINGTKDADHYIGETMLKQIPEAIKNPVAIIQSVTHPNRAVVLLKLQHNGKSVILPIEVDGYGTQNNISIDSNSVTSVFGKNNAITQLADAVTHTVNGSIELFYWNKKEALSLLQTPGLQLPSHLPQDGFIHSIRENGSKVKVKLENVTESQQFKRWFGKSKVVDENGKPKVVYHGTSKGGFSEFDTYAYLAKYGLFGNGAYFTEDRSVAEEYSHKGKGTNNQVYEVYLSIKNPLDMDATADAKKWNAALEREDIKINIPYGATNEAVLRLVEEELSDMDIPHYEGEEIVRNIFENMGYDGLTHIGGGRVNPDGVRHRVWIAFYPEQIKSVDNVGTFDGDNSDIYFATADGDSSAGSDSKEAKEAPAADTSAIEEEISIIDEALKDTSLPSADRVALIKEKVRLQRQLNEGRDVHGEEDTARTKKLEDAVSAYRESGDTSGIPTRQSVAASKKYYGAKISDIEAEMKQVYEALSNRESLSDMEYDELSNRYDALRTQWREAAKKNSVLAEVSDIHDEIDTAARPNHTWVRDIADWLADKKNLIKYGTYNLNDIERNFKIFFGKHFKTAYDKIIQPLYDSKKAYAEDVEFYAKRLKDEIVDGLGMKRGSKESAAVQWLGEGQKPISKKAGSDLAPYTYEDCVAEFGESAARRIQKAAEFFHEMYDDLLDQVNETRAMLYPNNPDKLIPRRSDYFRHFQEMSQGCEGLKNILQTNIGIDPMLVGVSENTKPKSKWQSFAQQRLGNRTTYDAVGGFLEYLPAAQYSIHIDPNIVNIRSLAYDLASAKAKENKGSGNPNANGFIAYLQRYANSLAGKTTSHFDRAIQDSNFGRTAMAVVSWLNNKTKASAVLGNINSVLSQVTNIKNVIGKIEHQSDVIQGAVDALAGLNPDGKISARYEESGFLKERYLDRVFSQFDRGWDKVNPVKWAADLLGFADEIGTRITWNAAYNEAKRKGIKDAVQYADNFTRACVAGRGIGEEALIFKSQVAKMFLPFRTEVLNDLRVQQDILFGEEYEVLGDGKKIKTSTAKRVKNIMQLYVASMVVNAVIAAIKSDEFEPLEEAKEGYEENGLLGALLSVMEDYADGTGNPVAFDPIYDIVTGIYQGVSEGESAGGKIGKATLRSAQNLAGDLVSNNPFSTAVMGMIGFDNDASDLLFNGNVYVPGGMGMPLAGSVTNVMRELGQGDYASAGAAAVKPFIPLGTQIDRSIKGIYDWTQGYATTEAAYDRMAGQEGSLKYLIEKTPETFIKSLLFGPGAFSGESDEFYNDKTRKFTPEEQAEILSHPDYESRKVTFDDILDMNVYDSERDERKQAAADEYFAGKEGTVLYNLYISGEEAAIPYKNMSGDTSFTDSKTGKKYTLDLKAGELEKLTGEVSDKIAARFERANESEVFATLSREEQVKYLEAVANAEYKQAKIKALYDSGQMSYEDYFRLESNYMEAEAKRDRVLYVDDAAVYVEFNAADTVGQYISYSDVPISEEGYEQLQKWRDYSSTRKPDSVDAELLRLSNATGSDINVSGNPYGIISYSKNKVDYKIELPDNQIYALCDEVDKAVRSALSSLFAKATYKNATAEVQKDLVADVRRDVRARIKAKYKSKYKSVKVDEFDRIVNMR